MKREPQNCKAIGGQTEVQCIATTVYQAMFKKSLKIKCDKNNKWLFSKHARKRILGHKMSHFRFMKTTVYSEVEPNVINLK